MSQGKYICIYREGSMGFDRDNYKTYNYEDPEIKRFENEDDMTSWINSKAKKERDAPKISTTNYNPAPETGYLFEWIYRGREEHGTFYQ